MAEFTHIKVNIFSMKVCMKQNILSEYFLLCVCSVMLRNKFSGKKKKLNLESESLVSGAGGMLVQVNLSYHSFIHSSDICEKLNMCQLLF